MTLLDRARSQELHVRVHKKFMTGEIALYACRANMGKITCVTTKSTEGQGDTLDGRSHLQIYANSI